MLDNKNVIVIGGKLSRLYINPTTVAGPTGLVDEAGDIIPLAATIVAGDAGWIKGDDGISETRETSVTDIIGMQGQQVVRTIVTNEKWTFTATLLETNLVTLEAFYGAPVDPTSGLIITGSNGTGGRKSFVIDLSDTSGAFIRAYVPQGEITGWGDSVYNGTDAVGYEITITCYAVDNIAGSGKNGSVARWYSHLVN